LEQSKFLIANKKSQASILKRIDVSQPSPNYIQSNSTKYPGMTKLFRGEGWEQAAASARRDKENNAKLMSG